MSRRPWNAAQLERELLAKTPKTLAGVQALLEAAEASRKAKAHTDETTALHAAALLVRRLRYVAALGPDAALVGSGSYFTRGQLAERFNGRFQHLAAVAGQYSDATVVHQLVECGLLSHAHSADGYGLRFTTEGVAHG